MKYELTPRRFVGYLICLAIIVTSLCVSIYYFPFNLPMLRKASETGVRIPVKDRKGKWGYIDDKGKVVIPFTFDYSLSFDGPYAVADNKFFIDRSGKRVSDVYSQVDPFRESDLSMIANYGKFGIRKGFVDRSLNVVIAPVWNVESSFDDFDPKFFSTV